MRILVDTSVWSFALRRRRVAEPAVAAELAELIREGRVAMIGPIRQELLSGIKSAEQYEELRRRLWAFPDLELISADYEEASACFNRCRRKGVQGSNTDFLICAASLRRDLEIYTVDKDFPLYARVLKIRLYQPRW